MDIKLPTRRTVFQGSDLERHVCDGQVVDVSHKEKVKQRPQALNTVELMRVASSGLGLSPHTAMMIAERLYTQVGVLERPECNVWNRVADQFPRGGL